MINDILHSHVGDFNIWSNTDNFAFPMVINLAKVTFNTHSVNYATHPHCFSLFLCGVIWQFYHFGKEDIYCVTSELMNCFPHKV